MVCVCDVPPRVALSNHASLIRTVMTHTTFVFRCAIAALGFSVVCACGGSTEPCAEQAVEVRATSVPMEVASAAGFDVVGTYGRGACVTTRPVIVKDADTVLIVRRRP